MTAPEIWRLVTPSVNGAYGHPVGYQIDGHGALTLLTEDDYMQRRAGFTNHTLWVTPYRSEELYAAGDYPTLSTAGDWLPKWTAANRPIANTDVVAWLTMGFHHVPHMEDWPVMSTMWKGITLMPFQFFDHNPAITIRNP